MRQMAFIARYGHQDIDKIRHWRVAEVQLLYDCLFDLVEAEPRFSFG